MMTDYREAALDYLECVRRLDTQEMVNRFAEGARVWLPGRGWMEPSGLAALLEGARSLLVDGIRFAHEDVLAIHDRVVVMTTCDSPLVKGGAYVNQFCFVFTFDDDGKITEMREYTDSGPAIAAFHS
jgi:ketosteroid isomerase-like protein